MSIWIGVGLLLIIWWQQSDRIRLERTIRSLRTPRTFHKATGRTLYEEHPHELYWWDLSPDEREVWEKDAANLWLKDKDWVGHLPGCAPDPLHPGYWLCQERHS